MNAIEWLGIEPAGDGVWRLPVTPDVQSGASALFGGCAMAAALAVVGQSEAKPFVSAIAHYTGFNPVGSVVTLTATTIASGRTLAHHQVVGSNDTGESFVVRAAFGQRDAVEPQGQWLAAGDEVPSLGAAAPFELPVHDGTWAARFEWRLAASVSASADGSAHWWVRPIGIDDPITVAAILLDYVTYGMGRALGSPLGGLSIDNVVRMVTPRLTEWVRLQVRPDALVGGFGHGSSMVWTSEGELIGSGNQSIVANGWDWRLPSERDG